MCYMTRTDSLQCLTQMLMNGRSLTSVNCSNSGFFSAAWSRMPDFLLKSVHNPLPYQLNLNKAASTIFAFQYFQQLTKNKPVTPNGPLRLYEQFIKYHGRKIFVVGLI